jgi:AbrB family looped-hinge helix DNA binding protein
MEIETTRIGERGQIVIPLDFRQHLNLKKGEKLIVAMEGDKLVIEQMKNIDADSLNQLKEELADIKIANKFWEDVKKGAVIKQSKEEFLADLESW